MELPFIIALSVLVQLAAAVLALRLIRLTGGRKAWLYIAAALFLMALRRIVPLYRILQGDPAYPSELSFELLGLFTSACMLAGIAGIEPLFRSVRANEEAVRRSEKRLQTIIDTAQEGIAVLDETGKVGYANRRFAEMLGDEAAEVAGRSCLDLAAPSFRTEAGRIMERHERGVREREDFLLRRKDGSDLWAIVSCNLLHDDDGRRVGMLAMFADISDRKRMEVEREVLIRDLQEALASVKTLRGMLPICSSCKKIRDDRGYWNQLESYLAEHSGAEFTHSYCPECARRVRAEIRG